MYHYVMCLENIYNFTPSYSICRNLYLEYTVVVESCKDVHFNVGDRVKNWK